MTEDWHRWFAWHPVLDINGKWCWGYHILRQWIPELYYQLDSNGYAHPVGGWKYLS
jgi:hypothetical protein